MKAFVYPLLLITSISACAQNHNACDQNLLLPHQIQGNGSKSPLLGQEVKVSGVVTAVLPGLEGFFIQSQQADQSAETSEGLFIHHRKSKGLEPGQLVAVAGKVSEQYDVTQLEHVESVHVCKSSVTLPASVKLGLPLSVDLEYLEGMRVRLADAATITDHYQWPKYGEITVSSEPHFGVTQLHAVNSTAAKAYQKFLNKDRLIIDDGKLAAYPDPLAPGPSGQVMTAKNRWKMGDQVVAEGILHHSFGRFKLQPTSPVTLVKPAANLSGTLNPGGQWHVASFNVLNFFTTLDQGDVMCGPTKEFSCRGADTKSEYQRQLNKLVQAINTADAAVVGLQELENNKDESIKGLVHALNEDAGLEKWAYIDTGVLGEDVIKVGLIYQPSKAKTRGAFALLNSKANPAFKEHQHRIVVAQTFEANNGSLFNVASIHLKSKSCTDAEGLNLSQKDGQGCYNLARQEGARQLGEWMNQDPTGQGAKMSILAGDFNAYQQEDPIQVLAGLGFQNLAPRFLGEKNWTTSYRGKLGSLDYILVNQAAAKAAIGLSQWHINSIESGVFGYNQEALVEGVEKPASFYQPGPTSSSDHDLLIAGFE